MQGLCWITDGSDLMTQKVIGRDRQVSSQASSRVIRRNLEGYPEKGTEKRSLSFPGRGLWPRRRTGRWMPDRCTQYGRTKVAAVVWPRAHGA